MASSNSARSDLPIAPMTTMDDLPRSRAMDIAIEVGRERDELRRALTELYNRHGLLRQTLAAVRSGEAGPKDARGALIRDADLAPEDEHYESQPEAAADPVEAIREHRVTIEVIGPVNLADDESRRRAAAKHLADERLWGHVA